jgi:cold shock protein
MSRSRRCWNNLFEPAFRENPFQELPAMPEGTIKKLMDKGFGFISTGEAKDLFFHSKNLEGVSFDELREGQKVSFTKGQGPKGPQAENVKVV